MLRWYLHNKSFPLLNFSFHVSSDYFLVSVISSLDSDLLICASVSLARFIESQWHLSNLLTIIVDASSREILVCDEVYFTIAMSSFSKFFVCSCSCFKSSRYKFKEFLTKLVQAFFNRSCLVWSLLVVPLMLEVSLVLPFPLCLEILSIYKVMVEEIVCNSLVNWKEQGKNQRQSTRATHKLFRRI